MIDQIVFQVGITEGIGPFWMDTHRSRTVSISTLADGNLPIKKLTFFLGQFSRL